MSACEKGQHSSREAVEVEFREDLMTSQVWEGERDEGVGLGFWV